MTDGTKTIMKIGAVLVGATVFAWTTGILERLGIGGDRPDTAPPAIETPAATVPNQTRLEQVVQTQLDTNRMYDWNEIVQNAGVCQLAPCSGGVIPAETTRQLRITLIRAGWYETGTQPETAVWRHDSTLR